ncbi:MAG: AHH domain-containing protein, partial [Tannerella sp.]|nr:AHH domain-containing protein [Tannerella sp.]
DKEALYLFFVDKVTGKEGDYAGYMPLQYQSGFIYDNPSAMIIAHELAHGAFTLYHTFSSDQFIASQGATANLMDYTNGTELWKHQWQLISNPKNLWFKSWQEEEEGEAASASEKGIVLEEEGIFVAPNNQLVKLPAQVEILYMCNYEESLNNKGYLYKFRKDNKVWESGGTMSAGGYLFDGYYNNGQRYTEENDSVKADDIVWVVKQDINFKPNCAGYKPECIENRNLSIQKVRIKSTAYPSFYDESEALSAATSMTVTVSCSGSQSSGIDWTRLKPDLDKLHGKLNNTWNVNVIDKDGKNHSLATGNKGTVTYKYDTNKKKWIAEVLGISNQEVKGIIVDAINKKLDAFQIDENRNSKIDKTTTTPLTTEDGGEFRFGDGLRWYEWGSVLCDAGISIYETFRLPETYWNQSNPKYKDYPLHTSPTFTGVADGVIEEITGIAQLVKLGVEIVTDKEKAQALWESVKKINLSTIKEAATGAIKDKWDKYANSPSYITYHELGKDGVQIASMLYGGFAAKGRKLSEAVEESGEIIKKKVDDILEETWQLSKQKLGHAADSKVLGDNLDAVGKVRPDNSAAHHIVAGKHAGADEARRLLKEEGIDINEAANGVFLPQNSKYVIDEASPHANIHTTEYFQNINNRLQDTPIGKRRKELQKIAVELQNGTFPY